MRVVAFRSDKVLAILGLAALLWCAAATAREAAGTAPLDLNSATLQQIQTLPIPKELARRIYDYRTYVSYFSSVYDLMEIEGMTPAILTRLKPLVATLPPPPVDASLARLAASYRQVSRYLGQEGASEGLVDEYLDMMRDPVNVNRLDLFDLQSFQNVSPVDAKNIIKARKRIGGFQNARQLRRSEGLRYWAYRNMRDFVVYNQSRLRKHNEVVHGNYEVRYYDTPYQLDDADVAWPLVGRGDPAMLHKLTLNLGVGVRGGLMSFRDVDEHAWNETVKGYYGVNDKWIGPFHLKRLYFGNYRVAFGQGLVMDNTDYKLSRKAGFGWNKRLIGVRGDLSRSHEFALTGAAMEGSIGRFHTTLFFSSDRKDGILNPDGTVNQYVVMQPRPPVEWLDRHLAYEPGRSYTAQDAPDTPTLLRRNAFREDIVGGNLKVMLGDASYVGVTAYQADYDRAFRADPTTLVTSYAISSGYLDARDSELGEGYSSVVDDPANGTRREHRFRRIYGAEFQTVFDNVSLAGEYGYLQDPDAGFLKGNGKDALLLNAYGQWSDLSLLAIYRDYDVGYDNPYNRAFANDGRYEQTLLDSPYRLNDDLYSWLSLNTPQPKPEKGLFLSSRYRISRNLIVSGLDYDQWERKADGADMRRYTLRLEYQPIFNLRLRLRHRYSSRSEQDAYDVRWFRSWETRWELHALLSHYDRLKLMYMTSNVNFPPRPRLSGPPEAAPPGSYQGVPGVGSAGMPAHAFQASLEHHLTPLIKLTLSSEMYDGFLWNFEGNEFVVVDGRGFRNWFKVESRVSDRLLFQLKVTRDHNLPRTYLDIRQYGEEYGLPIESDYAPLDLTSLRLQMDYTF